MLNISITATTNTSSNTATASSSCHVSGASPLLLLPLLPLILATVAGNLLVMCAAARSPVLRPNPTGVLLTSLACSDLLMGLLVLPMGASQLASGGRWVLGRAACVLWMSVDVLCVTASIQMLCAIALDRYVAVTRPLRYPVLVSKRRARAVVCVIWLVAVVTMVPMIPMVTESPWKQAEGCCDFKVSPEYALASSVVSFYLPLVVMVFVYGRVYTIARRQLRHIDCDQRRFRPSEDSVDAAELLDSTQRCPPSVLTIPTGTTTLMPSKLDTDPPSASTPSLIGGGGGG
ncbi:beta-3 adrenergic receptor-like, partial [Engraulis encrasicolus]|uniref:beta-3 adrenergic receptor-like n=1 Tax=Engraulis encrasicolus TaxID=184585 RepID=UPI002FCFCF5C